jgi:uncharacterized protein (TIGR00661 family)
MKIMFTVQGDGRGHMTQAIAAAQTFEREGHEIVSVTVGTNPSRAIPEFFARVFGDRLRPIRSPGFSFQGGKGVSTLATLRQAVSGRAQYRESLISIADAIASTHPDLIVNFLEPLTGLFNLLLPHRIPVVSVGHQFMLRHPEFVHCDKLAFQQWTMRQYFRLSGARSTKVALSFYPAAPIPERRLFVCPPLLRAELFDLRQDQPGRFLLAYVLNQGYTEDILRWHSAYPDVELHCFCEKPKIEPVWQYDSTLSFHKLDGAKFLRMMAESRGVACTAGFESLNEAAWLGKPLLVVPVANHVEQHLNALDAQKAGLALAADRFDLTPLLSRPSAANLEGYRSWVRQAGPLLLAVLEEITHRAVRKYVPAYSGVGGSAPVAIRGGGPALLEANSHSICRDKPAPAVSICEVAAHH